MSLKERLFTLLLELKKKRKWHLKGKWLLVRRKAICIRMFSILFQHPLVSHQPHYIAFNLKSFQNGLMYRNNEAQLHPDLPFSAPLSLTKIIVSPYSMKIITWWIKKTKLQCTPWILPTNAQNLSKSEDFNELKEYEDVCTIQMTRHQMYEEGL